MLIQVYQGQTLKITVCFRLRALVDFIFNNIFASMILFLILIPFCLRIYLLSIESLLFTQQLYCFSVVDL